MIKNPLVYIILVNYNGIVHTKECIESLKKISYDNYKIIVVDNASDDNNINELKKMKDEVEVIFSDKNLGFSGGNNLAIKKAIKDNAEYVLLLNNDTTVECDFLEILIESYKKNVGICTGKIKYYYEKDVIWYAGGDINKIKGNSKVYGWNEKDIGQFDNKKEVTFASGCCMLINTDVIKKVGYLSDDYFLYFEDNDYCAKIIKAKYSIMYCPDAVIYHKESVSTVKKSFNYDYYFTRNRLYFIKYNLERKYRISAYGVAILSGAYKVLKRERNFSAYILGIKDFICNKKGKI